MEEPIRALSELTRSCRWPDRWMTLTEISSELDDFDFWQRANLPLGSDEARLHWLRRALQTRQEPRRTLWLRMGGRYKHFDLVVLNRADVDAYLEWVRETRAAR